MSLTIKSVVDAFTLQEEISIPRANDMNHKIEQEIYNNLIKLMSKTAEGNINIQLGNIFEEKEIEEQKNSVLEFDFLTIN